MSIPFRKLVPPNTILLFFNNWPSSRIGICLLFYSKFFMSNIIEFVFDNKVVEFDVSGADVMVNATEMGKIYNKEPYDFLKQDGTKRFIAELKSAFAEFRTDPESELNAGNAVFDDEIVVRTERGKRADGGATWMHRQLALKFAAWLDPKFEVWVYRTIDTMLFEHTRKTTDELKEKARLTDRKDEIIQQLQGNELFQEYRLIEYRLRQISNRIGKYNNSQLDLFRAKD